MERRCIQSAAALPSSGLLCFHDQDREYHWQAVKVLSPSAPNRGHPVFWSRALEGDAVLCLSLLASRRALTVVWIELGAATRSVIRERAPFHSLNYRGRLLGVAKLAQRILLVQGREACEMYLVKPITAVKLNKHGSAKHNRAELCVPR